MIKYGWPVSRLLAIIIILTLPLDINAQTFTRITIGSIGNDGGSSYSASWVDYDNDGHVDIYVGNANYPSGEDNFLYRNNGSDGTFTKVTGDIITSDGGISYGHCWGDYDNDNDLDLYVTNWNNNINSFYTNNGDGSFSEVTTGALVEDNGYSTNCSWVDFDNDGDLDLYVTNEHSSPPYSAVNHFYRNDNGTFTKITSGQIATDVANSHGLAWADYDNDGDMDLFVANLFGTSPQNNCLYQNNGDGSFAKITSSPVTTSGGYSTCGSWGDYDNDGDLDLYVANSYGFGNYFYVNNGDGTFTNISGINIVTDVGWTFGCSWVDYDNDADLDLFLTQTVGDHSSTSNNRLYQNNNDGTFTRITEGDIVNIAGWSWGAVWGDYDRDGNQDLFVARSQNENEDNLLFKNSGIGHNWIIVKCIGTLSNTSAIGAKVRVKAQIDGESTWQMREIVSATGYTTQHSMYAHFGLLDALLIDSIKVEWPSGMVNVLTDVDVNQYVTIEESTMFTRITEGPHVTDTGSSIGVSWADYDNDGDQDLYVTNNGSSPSYTTTNNLYRNDGSGNFAPVSGLPLTDDIKSWRGSSWGDFDNDGNIDVFVTSFINNANSLFKNTGNGLFEIVVGQDVSTDLSDCFDACWGDYDKDGDLDLFQPNEDGDTPSQNALNFLYRNDDNIFNRINTGPVADNFMPSQSAEWVDYDNDNDIDLFVVNSKNSNNMMFQNDGSGNFSQLSGNIIVEDGGESSSATWADFDNDGDMDLFIANMNWSSNGQNFLYENTGGGGFEKILSGEIVNDQGASFGGSAKDFDNDGDLDLLVTGTPGIILYENMGDWNFVKNTEFDSLIESGFYLGHGWADYDRDGDLDIYIASISDEKANYLMSNNGNLNNFISIRCIGTISNHSGLGSKVRVKAIINGLPSWQVREISVGDGNYCQSELNAHFGLGDATIIDSIKVEWPSGLVDILTDVSINQYLEITEPGYVTGDANGDFEINVGDAVYVINNVFKGGPAPDPVLAGDANCDEACNVGDAVYIINHVFKGGLGPGENC